MRGFLNNVIPLPFSSNSEMLPSPLTAVSLFSVFVSLFLFCLCVYYILHISEITWYLSFNTAHGSRGGCLNPACQLESQFWNLKCKPATFLASLYRDDPQTPIAKDDLGVALVPAPLHSFLDSVRYTHHSNIFLICLCWGLLFKR